MERIITFITGIAIISGVAACVYGWALNIAALTYQNETVGRTALRFAGIFFAPLGVVLGYI